MNGFAVVIFGPTGVGKSLIALDLARDNGEIISVDSMQVYKYMDIGTAKPDKEEQKNPVWGTTRFFIDSMRTGFP